MGLDFAQLVLWWASVALEVILLARVAFSFRRLKWFMFALGAMVLQDLSLFPLQPHSKIYFGIWAAGLLIVLCAQSGAAIEAHRNMLRAYPGIGALGKSLVLIAIVAALGATALSSGPDLTALDSPDRRLSLAFAGARAWSSVLGVFLLCVSSLLFWFDVPHRPNDKAHLTILTSFLSLHTITFLVKNAYRQYLAIENVASAAIACVCLIAWLITLTPRGEIVERSKNGSLSEATFDQWNEEALEMLRSVRRR